MNTYQSVESHKTMHIPSCSNALKSSQPHEKDLENKKRKPIAVSVNVDEEYLHIQHVAILSWN
ncbi:MAG: hypothetical protein ACHQJ6_05870 [Candidatus Berkiellales bacterium]